TRRLRGWGMRAGGGSVPWPVVAIIVVIALLALSSYTGLILTLLVGGVGVWLVATAGGGLRGGGGRGGSWGGQRRGVDRGPGGQDGGGRGGQHRARSVLAIRVGLAVIGFVLWNLLLR